MLLFYSTKPVPASLHTDKLTNQPDIAAVCCYAMLLQPGTRLTARQQAILEEMLETRPVIPVGQPVYVFPRIGTKSPFASKAEDILRQIGFSQLVRIEEGVALYSDQVAPIDPAAWVALIDPMLHQIYPDQEMLAAESIGAT